MRPFVPCLMLLSACSSPPADPGLREEIASLKLELQELRKIHAPGVAATEAMDDLAREVKKLREKTPAPPPPSPVPPLKEMPNLSPLPNGTITGGVGGMQTGVSDLFWVLARVTVDGDERTVLVLYQATSKGFRLNGVRWLGPDLQIVEMNQDKPHVKEVLEGLKRK